MTISTKYFAPSNQRSAKQQTVTLFLPTRNKLAEANAYAINALRLYAKRSKLYAAFNLFAYQQRELIDSYSPAMGRTLCKQGDCSGYMGAPGGLVCARADTRKTFYRRKKRFRTVIGRAMSANRKLIEIIWGQLTNLGAIFEEVVREGFLPTVLGQML